MHGELHSIIQLEVHLENAKQITFNLSQTTTDMQGWMREKSKLEAFFELNREDSNA